MTGTTLQRRGGSTTATSTFTGAARELTVDTTKNTIVVHDGSTAGGHPLLREDMSNVTPATGRAALGLPAFNTTATPNATPEALASGALDPSWLVNAPPAFKNILIGGDFAKNPWVRGTSFTNVANAYTADRWFVYGAAVASVSKVSSGLAGFPSAFRLQRPSGSSSTSTIYAVQVVESVNCIPLQGKTVTLSFLCRVGANFSASGSQVVIDVASGTAADEGAVQLFSGWTGLTYPSAGTYTASTSWQTFTVTGTVPSGCQELAVMLAYTPTGTAGANDYMDIACVQLEAGSVATPFEALPQEVVLQRCRRYAEKSYDQGVSPGTAATPGGESYVVTAGLANSADLEGTAVRFAVQKRGVPTITTYSTNSGTAGKAFDLQNDADVTSYVGGIGMNGFTWYANPSASATQTQLALQWFASAEL